MTLEEMHRALAQVGLGPQPADDDGLAVMLFLHTHHLQLGAASLSDRPGVRDLAALAQRHAAEVVAAAWPSRQDSLRMSPQHWYYEFNTRTPFEVVEDMEPFWAERVAGVRERILKSGLVQAITLED
jgi:hypothetical protein